MYELPVIGDKDRVNTLSNLLKDFCIDWFSYRGENCGFHPFLAICMVVGRLFTYNECPWPFPLKRLVKTKCARFDSNVFNAYGLCVSHIPKDSNPIF